MRAQRPCMQPLLAVTKQSRVPRSLVCCMQVVQTDEAVFETIQDKFVALTANLLPKLVSVLPVRDVPCLRWGLLLLCLRVIERETKPCLAGCDSPDRRTELQRTNALPQQAPQERAVFRWVAVRVAVMFDGKHRKMHFLFLSVIII